MIPFVGAGVKLLGVDISKTLGGIPVVGGLFKSGSPRYAGDGPLISTVNGFLRRVATGETAVLHEIWRTGVIGSKDHKRQWRQFWDTDLQQAPMSAAQRAVVVQLDPTKAGVIAAAQPHPGAPAQVHQVNAPSTQLFQPSPAQPAGAVDKVAAELGTSSSTLLIGAAVLAVLVVLVLALRRP